MLDSEPFLSLELMSEILSEFEWPQEYKLEDELPDGINVAFPKSNFFFTETPDGDVIVKFLPENTRQGSNLHLGHALAVLVPESERTGGPITPGLIENEWPFPSEDKTRIGIRNACTIMLTHMRDIIAGDYSWVIRYLQSSATSDE